MEKDGLQVFRNYQRAFDAHAEKEFAREVDSEPFDTDSLVRIVALLAEEDARFLPVIACAYFDDQLKAMFKAETPKNVPGGASALFGPYGPLSDLFNRLQLAAVFNMLSPDLVRDVDRLRKARNDISHFWDISAFQNFFGKGEMAKLNPIEKMLAEETEKLPLFSKKIEPLKAFRMRLIWLTARFVYEASYYARAKRYRLRPEQALFGDNRPKRLSTITGLALRASKKLLEK